MAASTASSSHTNNNGTLSPSAASSIAGSSTFYSVSGPSSTTATIHLSGVDHLRDTFTKRIRSLAYLKRSLQGQTAWFSAIQLDPNELHSFFDNDRMNKRTLRYSLLGLSLSSILEIPNPSDLARAIVSLLNELESYTDDNIAALTSGAGAANFGTQRPKVRSFFKSGKQTLKRSTAAQAISEFGTMDSGIGPASTLAGGNEQNSYLMAPNIPFQLDFFQTFFTLCDMLTEVYYKMLSFLPREATAAESAAQNQGTFGRASSPPTSASGNVSQDHDRSGSISQAFSSTAAGDLSGEVTSEKPGPTISAMTQELLLKADAKIKKAINAQVKDIDVVARQMIKDELASLDPLMKDLGLDAAVGANTALPPTSQGAATARPSGPSSGLPTTSTSALPFGFAGQPTTSSTIPATSNTAPSRLSNLVTASQFRRGPAGSHPKPDSRSPQDSAHYGHHHFNLGSNNASAANAKGDNEANGLLRSRSGRLRRMVSGTDREQTVDAGVPMYPGSTGVSPSKDS